MKNVDLLKGLVEGLVDRRESVSVSERREGPDVHYTVDVHPSDRGKIIGRGGSIITSIRTVFGHIGGAEGRRIYITILGAERSREFAA